jgi:hypothetical protein
MYKSVVFSPKHPDQLRWPHNLLSKKYWRKGVRAFPQE